MLSSHSTDIVINESHIFVPLSKSLLASATAAAEPQTSRALLVSTICCRFRSTADLTFLAQRVQLSFSHSMLTICGFYYMRCLLFKRHKPVFCLKPKKFTLNFSKFCCDFELIWGICFYFFNQAFLLLYQISAQMFVLVMVKEILCW